MYRFILLFFCFVYGRTTVIGFSLAIFFTIDVCFGGLDSCSYSIYLFIFLLFYLYRSSLWLVFAVKFVHHCPLFYSTFINNNRSFVKSYHLTLCITFMKIYICVCPCVCAKESFIFIVIYIHFLLCCYDSLFLFLYYIVVLLFVNIGII